MPQNLTDISRGGYAFNTEQPIPVGSGITIDIPQIAYGHLRNGYVVWCRKKEQTYLVGVQFADEDSAFHAHMVEQICYIEQYRRRIAENEGRQLTSEEAAHEWIAHNAAGFP